MANFVIFDKEKLGFCWIGASKTDTWFKETPHDRNSEFEIIVTDCFDEVFQTTL